MKHYTAVLVLVPLLLLYEGDEVKNTLTRKFYKKKHLIITKTIILFRYKWMHWRDIQLWWFLWLLQHSRWIWMCLCSKFSGGQWWMFRWVFQGL